MPFDFAGTFKATLCVPESSWMLKTSMVKMSNSISTVQKQVQHINLPYLFKLGCAFRNKFPNYSYFFFLVWFRTSEINVENNAWFRINHIVSKIAKQLLIPIPGWFNKICCCVFRQRDLERYLKLLEHLKRLQWPTVSKCHEDFVVDRAVQAIRKKWTNRL